jgi:hypothetical protein
MKTTVTEVMTKDVMKALMKDIRKHKNSGMYTLVEEGGFSKGGHWISCKSPEGKKLFTSIVKDRRGQLYYTTYDKSFLSVN